MLDSNQLPNDYVRIAACILKLEPTFSLELNPPRYKGGIPPANTSRAKLVDAVGIEPT